MDFLYTLNYSPKEKDLAFLEMKTFFPTTWNNNIEDKIIFSDRDIDASDSPFIKGRLGIIFQGKEFQQIIDYLQSEKITSEDFKVEYFRLECENIPYQERLEKCREIGMRIVGTPLMTGYKKLFGITKYRDLWFFGVYEKNSFSWQNRVDKPHSYSNSLDVKLGKTLINLATGGDKTNKVADVCSGIGTIVIEGLAMGVDIVGYEINDIIADNANQNLIHYGFHPAVTNRDMHLIREFFHSSILDIPYGIFSHITREEQQNLINKCREISKRMILVSFENLEDMIAKSGFKILDKATLPKGKFQRHIWICE
ncbi:MAG: TRM11 family SAM-dependent methyltransferase [Fusobacteriaceae bacterium]